MISQRIWPNKKVSPLALDRIHIHLLLPLLKGIIEKSKTITPKIYLEIENILKELSNQTNTNLGELDLYLWYEETGKVLKWSSFSTIAVVCEICFSRFICYQSVILMNPRFIFNSGNVIILLMWFTDLLIFLFLISSFK